MSVINVTIGGTSKRSKFTPKALTISWEEIPQASRDFLINYGIKQYLGDGAAGAETQHDFDQGILDRYEQVFEGTCGKRQAPQTAGPTDDPEKVAKQIAADTVKRRIKAANAKLGKEQVASAIERYYEVKKDALLAEAATEIAKRQKAASAKASDIDAMFKELGIG